MLANGDGRIVVSGLTKAFGAVKAVDDLNFTVEPGTVAGFLGPNGAGKTTTLRMVVGLVKPDSGSATINGVSYAAMPSPNSQVGAVLEASGFHPGRSGRQHLKTYCLVNGYPGRRADEVLELVGLTSAAKRSVKGYSLGMRQRLALAAALLGDPQVMILDEPANGLDPEGIVWMRGLLREFAAKGRTVLVSSHVLTEMQQLVDHAVIINKGRLVRQGTLGELSEKSGGVVARTPDPDKLIDALRRAGHDASRASDGRVEINGADTARVGHIAFVEGVEIHELFERRSDLERVFFELTAGGYEGRVLAMPGVG
ncbi:ABC transporter ATP-binding protein [Amycolatopsis sp. TNS106]|uniref:ABC transporter ATP-binding protein n=1 Tax=Amycolatopsis sp. TNS106 TaxID=2861750 RepID=UPI001C5A06D7|nr:ATP-binding cassette domain-containing protein [Amycolatopsis sp. TNS106]QXV56948.1 ABC transporter ATP-binding protein [Amycolatopsis sp. TNS106]